MGAIAYPLALYCLHFETPMSQLGAICVLHCVTGVLVGALVRHLGARPLGLICGFIAAIPGGILAVLLLLTGLCLVPPSETSIRRATAALFDREAPDSRPAPRLRLDSSVAELEQTDSYRVVASLVARGDVDDLEILLDERLVRHERSETRGFASVGPNHLRDWLAKRREELVEALEVGHEPRVASARRALAWASSRSLRFDPELLRECLWAHLAVYLWHAQSREARARCLRDLARALQVRLEEDHLGVRTRAAIDCLDLAQSLWPSSDLDHQRAELWRLLRILNTEQSRQRLAYECYRDQGNTALSPSLQEFASAVGSPTPDYAPAVPPEGLEARIESTLWNLLGVDPREGGRDVACRTCDQVFLGNVGCDSVDDQPKDPRRLAAKLLGANSAKSLSEALDELERVDPSDEPKLGEQLAKAARARLGAPLEFEVEGGGADRAKERRDRALTWILAHSSRKDLPKVLRDRERYRPLARLEAARKMRRTGDLVHLLDALREEESPAVRQVIEATIVDYHSARRLRGILSAHARLRAPILDCLGAMSAEGVFDPVLELTASAEEEVREAALRALARIRTDADQQARALERLSLAARMTPPSEAAIQALCTDAQDWTGAWEVLCGLRPTRAEEGHTLEPLLRHYARRGELSPGLYEHLRGLLRLGEAASGKGADHLLLSALAHSGQEGAISDLLATTQGQGAAYRSARAAGLRALRSGRDPDPPRTLSVLARLDDASLLGEALSALELLGSTGRRVVLVTHAAALLESDAQGARARLLADLTRADYGAFASLGSSPPYGEERLVAAKLELLSLPPCPLGRGLCRVLTRELGSNSPRIRARAACALGDARYSLARAELMSLLDDPSPEVRDAATSALRELR